MARISKVPEYSSSAWLFEQRVSVRVGLLKQDQASTVVAEVNMLGESTSRRDECLSSGLHLIVAHLHTHLNLPCVVQLRPYHTRCMGTAFYLVLQRIPRMNSEAHR